MAALFKRAFHQYHHWLTTQPLVTKCVTACAIFAVGDILAQTIAGEPVIDYSRTARLAAWGLLGSAPIDHLKFEAIEKLVPPGPSAVIFKVVLDQFLFTPPITALFFLYAGLTDGSGQAYERTLLKLWPTLKINWLVWPVIQTFNFGMVPLEYRVLVGNFCSIFWAAFLSATASSNL
eukprot:TRINITY_DN20930_c0_g1_i1.p1 TRINITY_DN20930_c0_g1~~TRINITY_DN20930_c0_g1_i1.p1  ORF type:complete len:177 (+),score=37.06 TRINITY_DN20930_c0_g1_i1:40-570(+)